MKRFSVFFLLFLLFSPCTFSATTFLTGHELLEYCQSTLDVLDYNFGRVQMETEYHLGSNSGKCQGYIIGVNETLSKKHYCVPSNYNMLETASVVVKYLKDHPQELNCPASLLIARAYQKYFPCG